jgi:hypothetical protein
MTPLPTFHAHRAAALCATVLATLAALAPSARAAATDSLTLSPPRVIGSTKAGTRLAPLNISNTTGRAYRVQVVPVILRQGRNGALQVGSDAESRLVARQLLDVPATAFPLAPGQARSIRARVRRRERGGATAGLLFRAVPAHRGSGITSVLQLAGAVYLRAPGARTRLATEPIRSEQTAPGKIRLIAPVRNAGSAYVSVRARIIVRDAAGGVVARARVGSTRIIPGATVDLAAPLRARLNAGAYRIEARMSSGRVRVRATGTMHLYGTNAVRTTTARIARVRSLEVVAGEPMDVDASFANTGNVPWAPRATYEIRDVASGAEGRALATGPLETRSARPGARMPISGQIALPKGMRQAEVAIVLHDRHRELDRRSVTVTVRPRPPLSAQITDIVTRNAVLLVTVLMAALVLAMGATVMIALRARTAAAKEV